MKPNEVIRRVEQIKDVRADDEAAHGMEDDLWYDVLMAIAAGARNPSKLAAEALKTRNIDFARWYA